MRNLGARGGGKKFVHRAAFVGLHMPEGNPAQPLERNDARDRLRYERKHVTQTGMEKQRFVGIDQKLVEREAARRRLGNARRKAVNAVGDFMSVCLHRRSPGAHLRRLQIARPWRERLA
jgi:hypothetical protein